MSATGSDNEIPVVPDFDLVRRIGGGAYGDVWLARGVTGAWRAVKIVRRSQFEHERTFEREFEGIRKFEPISRSHDGFVQILHVGRNGAAGFYYCVMELADPVGGGPFDPASYRPQTLSASRGSETWPVERVLAVGRALAEALARLHAEGLAHRDIKPSNVIFVGGKPKLADIGMVAATGQRSFVGTEGYVPPEGPGSSLADIYSLGKVLYEIATGQDRLDFPTLPAGWFGEGGERAKKQALNDMICEACAPVANDRQWSAEELARDLAGIAAGKPAGAPGRWQQRAVAAVALFAMAIAIAVGLRAGKWRIEGGGSTEPGGAGGSPTPAVAIPTPDPTPAAGSVKLVSAPAGARVFENGKEIGSTPLYLDALSAGPVSYQLVRPGFRTVTVTGEVLSGKQTVLGARMEVWLPPVAGEVWKNSLGIPFLPVDGRHVASKYVILQDYILSLADQVPLAGDPSAAAELTAGEQEAFCEWLTQKERGDGFLEEGEFYRPARREELAQAGVAVAGEDANPEDGREPLYLAVDWKPVGSVRVLSDPAGAEIFRDGELVGKTPGTLERLVAGRMRLVFKRTGYLDAERDIDVPAGGVVEVSVALERGHRVLMGEGWENSLGMRFVPRGDVLFCVWETRVGDYALFCRESGRAGASAPDFLQTGDDPVVLVGRDDAEAFCAWLTGRERASGHLGADVEYRLPTDAEWSGAAGLGEESGASPAARDGGLKQVYPWGRDWPPPAGAGNFADQSARRTLGTKNLIVGYEDGFPETAPVGSFPANPGGIFDLAGNVWEWVGDAYGGGGTFADWAVCRGGGWSNSDKAQLASSYRNLLEPRTRDVIYGFRVVIAPVRE